MQLTKFIMLSLLLAALSGCESGELTHYTSPEVTGRVLAADTHQPLNHAEICRAGSKPYGSSGPPKGGTLLMEPVGARTDADGRFTLNSRSVVAVILKPGWSSVPVVFSHVGYETFQTNYTGANATITTNDRVPVMDVGDVLLRPAAE